MADEKKNKADPLAKGGLLEALKIRRKKIEAGDAGARLTFKKRKEDKRKKEKKKKKDKRSSSLSNAEVEEFVRTGKL